MKFFIKDFFSKCDQSAVNCSERVLNTQSQNYRPSDNVLTGLSSAINSTFNKFSLLHYSLHCSFWASVYPFVYTDCYESPIKETKIPSSNTFKQNNVHYDVISKLIPFLVTNDFRPSHYQCIKNKIEIYYTFITFERNWDYYYFITRRRIISISSKTRKKEEI